MSDFRDDHADNPGRCNGCKWWQHDATGSGGHTDVGLCMQPEYLREVTAEADYARPWFILIGEYDSKSGDVLEKILRK